MTAVTPARAGEQCAGESGRARSLAARIEREWPLRGADEVTRFVRALGERLARHAAPPSQPWSFVVVRDRSANAFALGGGRIYITDGSIGVCRNEAELAAMLAHEMGHQVAGHLCRERASNGEGREAPTAADAAAARDIAIGSLRQHIDPRQEGEADRLAIRILASAGYDPRAVSSIAKEVRGLDAHATSAGLDESLEGVPAGGRTDSEEFASLKRQLAVDLRPGARQEPDDAPTLRLR